MQRFLLALVAVSSALVLIMQHDPTTRQLAYVAGSSPSVKTNIRWADAAIAPKSNADAVAATAQSTHLVVTHDATPSTLPLASRPLQAVDGWAFAETFDGDPAAPSQALLPRAFDYVVTHRTLPGEHRKEFDPYPADHGMDCSGPDPAVSPLPQHMVSTSHLTDGAHPDKSFFICKDHLMSSMGDVEGYSVTAFWPKQAFDFAAGGVLEFDVNLNDDNPRSWWEVLIVPRDELRVGAAQAWLPIDETYPQDRILLSFFNNTRNIQVGAGAPAPKGVIIDESDWTSWAGHHPDDPAISDRRIRRTMQIALTNGKISWAIQKADGSFDDYVVTVPGGLPFTRGLVLFKTHAYTPKKDGNNDNYTFHWDNIRFTGPVVEPYENYEADDMVYLQANSNREIGESAAVTITLPTTMPNPLLFGQVHNAMQGQVLLSINHGPQLTVNPTEYNDDDCYSTGWKSFVLPLEPSWLREGANTFTWTIGPRPTCVADWVWDGFSIKNLEVQIDIPVSTTPITDYKVHLPLIEQ